MSLLSQRRPLWLRHQWPSRVPSETPPLYQTSAQEQRCRAEVWDCPDLRAFERDAKRQRKRVYRPKARPQAYVKTSGASEEGEDDPVSGGAGGGFSTPPRRTDVNNDEERNVTAESQAAAARAGERQTPAASTPSDSIHPREQPKPGKKRTRNRQKPNVVSKNQQANTKKARPQSSSPVPLPSSPRRSARARRRPEYYTPCWD